MIVHILSPSFVLSIFKLKNLPLVAVGFVPYCPVLLSESCTYNFFLNCLNLTKVLNISKGAYCIISLWFPPTVLEHGSAKNEFTVVLQRKL